MLTCGALESVLSESVRDIRAFERVWVPFIGCCDGYCNAASNICIVRARLTEHTPFV